MEPADFGDDEQAAGIVLGYRSPDQHYIFAEPGAARSGYSIGEYVNGSGWGPLVAAGQLENLKSDREYLLQVCLAGQELKILADNVRVINYLIAHPLEGRQVGLIAVGATMCLSPISLRLAAGPRRLL